MDNLEQNNWEQYGAITLDTCIVQTKGSKFNTGILNELPKFKAITTSTIDFIIIDVVFKEMEKHLIEEEQKILNSYTQFSRKVNDYFSIDKDKLDEIERGLEKQRNKSLNNFIDLCGIKIIRSHNFSDIQSLVDMYFSNKAPFAKTGDKKNEFPDAIALLSLENWAKSNQKKILAISTDGDWKRFAETSNWIDVHDDLNELIQLLEFQRKKKLELEKKQEEKKIIDKLKKILQGTENWFSQLDIRDIQQEIELRIQEKIGEELRNDGRKSNLYYLEIGNLESEITDINSLKFLSLLTNKPKDYEVLFTCMISIEYKADVYFKALDISHERHKKLSKNISEEIALIATFKGDISEYNKMDIDIKVVDDDIKIDSIELGEIS